MEQFQETIKKIVEQLGLNDHRVEFDMANRRVAIFADEGEWLRDWLPKLVAELEHLFRLIAKKYDLGPIYVDFNNYRKERERLISEVAQAAARKALIEKKDVNLPIMNAYERRIVHNELATRPDVKTESAGEGKERHVIVKPL